MLFCIVGDFFPRLFSELALSRPRVERGARRTGVVGAHEIGFVPLGSTRKTSETTHLPVSQGGTGGGNTQMVLPSTNLKTKEESNCNPGGVPLGRRSRPIY